MDQSEMKRLVDFHRKRMSDFLGLSDWKIWYEIVHLGGFTMDCDTSDHVYNQAKIRVDYNRFDTDDEFVDDLFHEHCHILHASFMLYRHAYQKHTSATPADVHIEANVWSHAAEQFVLRMEWIWRNHLRALYLDLVTRPDPSP